MIQQSHPDATHETRTVRARCSPAHGRKPDGVVAAQDYGHRTGRRNVGDRVGNLIEGLLDVGGDGEDVPRVAHGHLLAQVHPRLVVVRRV